MRPTYDEYTLWLKWQGADWERFLTVKRHGRHTRTPRQVVYEWARANFPGKWDRKHWMVLPVDKEPAALSRAQQRKKVGND